MPARRKHLSSLPSHLPQESSADAIANKAPHVLVDNGQSPIQLSLADLAQSELTSDPLGYDTTDLSKCALAMSEGALSGRNHEAVRKEIEQVEARLAWMRDASTRKPTLRTVTDPRDSHRVRIGGFCPPSCYASPIALF